MITICNFSSRLRLWRILKTVTQLTFYCFLMIQINSREEKGVAWKKPLRREVRRTRHLKVLATKPCRDQYMSGLVVVVVNHRLTRTTHA